MPVYLPDDPALPSALLRPDALLVACLCAEWCGTCREYQPHFEALAQRLPEHVFVWVDIEDFPQVTDDDDVENFPTILIQSAGEVRFFGPMLPHIGHLEKLLGALADTAEAMSAQGPDLRTMLLQAK